jgi:serine/threonine-protein kinase PpkA
MSLDPPDIPGYRIERTIGQGGMATVYLARQLSLDRLVAIKLMVPEASAEETQAQRFEAEARVIARLEHPHIVGIHEVGRTREGRLYYVMPYLPNGDMAHRNLIDDEMRVVEILQALLDALGYAHARGIVHRDVKAENVLFDSADRPRLADFGIALSRRTGTPRITTDGLTLGSSGYMAPEQARGEPLDGRADLYSLGVLTHELLTGELPFQSDDPLALALMHDQDPLPRLPADRRHWQAFIDRATAKRPSRRFRNATAMLRALQQVERAIRRRRRGSWLLNAFATMRGRGLRPLLLVASGIGLALLLVLGWQWLQPPTEPTLPATVSTPEAVSASVEQTVADLLAAAEQQMASGALVVPAGDNAAESILLALRVDPLNERARAALEDLFRTLATHVAEAFEGGDDDQVSERIEQARLLADGLGDTGREAFTGVTDAAITAAEASMRRALAANDGDRARALIDLVAGHGIDSASLDAMLAEHRPPPVPGARLRDGRGPTLVLLPTSVIVGEQRSQLVDTRVMMDAPVSRADFGRFVTASGHQPARCRALLSPLRLVDQRNWEQPGFDQTPRDPVICIAPADAEAYAAWLSRQTGQTYRLPSIEELQHLALFARSRRNPAPFSMVSEWTSNCAPHREGTRPCARRIALDPGPDGRRWPLAPRELDAARGYEDAGFRLLREVHGARLPPPLQ